MDQKPTPTMDHVVMQLKALADPTRFATVALLAQAPRSGDELAALLDLNPSTISHHLAKLQDAGLVVNKTEQYYRIYFLQEQTLATLQESLVLPALIEMVSAMKTVDSDAYRQQILSRWIVDGKLQGLPTPIKQRDIVLQWLIDKFTVNVQYEPAQLDTILNQWCSWAHPKQLDITSITSALVAGNYLARKRDGSVYWRNDSDSLVTIGKSAPNAFPKATVAPMRAGPASQLRNLIKFAMNIPSNRPLRSDELTARIQRFYGQSATVSTEDIAAISAALLQEQLLEQTTEGEYLRRPITSDHPASKKLLAEGQNAQTESQTTH